MILRTKDMSGKGLTDDGLIKCIKAIQDLISDDLGTKKASEIIMYIRDRWKERISIEDNFIHPQYAFRLNRMMWITRMGFTELIDTIHTSLDHFKTEYGNEYTLTNDTMGLIDSLLQGVLESVDLKVVLQK